MIFIYVIFFLFSFNMCLSLHLTNQQKILINKILKNPKVTNYEKHHIQKILYNSYEKLAIKKAIEFKKIHKFKCKDIPLEELICLSRYGLFKSILKFKGYTFLEKYSVFYINHELYRLLNDKYSQSIIPKSIRSKSKNNMTSSEIKIYNYLLHNNENNDEWRIEKLNYIQSTNKNINYVNSNYFDSINIWSYIDNNLDLLTKKIFHLKYDFYFNRIRSNNEIANLLHYSEEYIRVKHKNSINLILNNLNIK